ncbi:MAG: hypothetical protein ISS25_01020 [Nanoarchaeota archaeon]|nr:hypothetical protein [DPANN group archaeon]MBL7116395.1 hypothetical protein [Nanoarchaeota archaeon]
MRRKGQMEIMGLIVIVILLTLGMVFIVSFKTSQPKREVKKSYEDDQLASNFIIAFLKTNSDCRKHTIENMIQDCAIEKRINCNGLSSCKYVNETINVFLDKTLKKLGKKFKFEIEGVSEEILFEADCTADQEKDSAFQPISLYPYPGTIVIRMDICE